MTTFLLRYMNLEATPCRALLRVERGSAVGHEHAPCRPRLDGSIAPKTDPSVDAIDARSQQIRSRAATVLERAR